MIDVSISHMNNIYWAPVYNHGDKTDYFIELAQQTEDTWRVTVDDNEFTMTTATPSSDFWGLVSDAIRHHRGTP